MTLVAVPYCRTSTDDKAQVPERQLERIRPWAERESVTLLDHVIDEGSSASKTNPFERPKFLLACERAVALGATAIVVETADRFTRQGAKQDFWAEIELQRRFNLRLFRADKPLSQHNTLVGDVVDALKAEGAREWVEEHARKVKSGMQKAAKDGKKFGRPPKNLTAFELARAREMRAKGLGWRKIAHALSEGRGAFRVYDTKAVKRRTVSHSHVRRQLEAEAPTVPKVAVEQKS